MRVAAWVAFLVGAMLMVGGVFLREELGGKILFATGVVATILALVLTVLEILVIRVRKNSPEEILEAARRASDHYCH